MGLVDVAQALADQDHALEVVVAVFDDFYFGEVGRDLQLRGKHFDEFAIVAVNLQVHDVARVLEPNNFIKQRRRYVLHKKLHLALVDFEWVKRLELVAHLPLDVLR